MTGWNKMVPTCRESRIKIKLFTPKYLICPYMPENTSDTLYVWQWTCHWKWKAMYVIYQIQFCIWSGRGIKSRRVEKMRETVFLSLRNYIRKFMAVIGCRLSLPVILHFPFSPFQAFRKDNQMKKLVSRLFFLTFKSGLVENFVSDTNADKSIPELAV